MITKDTIYNVKNRSTSMVYYKIPETNVRRQFAPGEVKKIPFEELEKLTFQQGGRELIENFLQIMDEVVTTDLNIHREYEYNMSEKDVKELLQSGSLDAFLDALDFAPIGVIDLIKAMSVQLPLTDFNKRKALREKTGFDVDEALRHEEEQKQEESNMIQPNAPSGRRVQPAASAEPAAPVRRTSSKYNVVKTTTTE